MELTSSPILMDTSPSRYTVGCTSRVKPTSRYCTLLLLAEPLLKSAVLWVITGTRLPIKILAFSLLRARMRGLAKVLVLLSVCSAFAVRLTDETWMVLAFWWLRSDRTRFEAPLEPGSVGSEPPECQYHPGLVGQPDGECAADAEQYQHLGKSAHSRAQQGKGQD